MCLNERSKSFELNSIICLFWILPRADICGPFSKEQAYILTPPPPPPFILVCWLTFTVQCLDAFWTFTLVPLGLHVFNKNQESTCKSKKALMSTRKEANSWHLFLSWQEIIVLRCGCKVQVFRMKRISQAVADGWIDTKSSMCRKNDTLQKIGNLTWWLFFL